MSSGPSGTKGCPYGFFFPNPVNPAMSHHSLDGTGLRSSTSQKTAQCPLLSFAYLPVDEGRNFIPWGCAPRSTSQVSPGSGGGWSSTKPAVITRSVEVFGAAAFLAWCVVCETLSSSGNFLVYF